jgi:serine protease
MQINYPFLSDKRGHEVSASEVIVKLRTANPLTLPQIQATGDIQLDKLIGGGRDLHLMRSRSLSVASLINALSGHPEVLYVEPNYIVRGTTAPNDPDYSQLWGLQNIAANAAWEISTGSTAIAVAVVDSGIDYTHPDLVANVWSAPAAFTVNIGGQAITCPAGTHGFNAILMVCDPMDDNGHGTYVSGILAQ